MRYLSVCSGIEAATVAWHPLGWTPVAFSEIEAFPSAVLAHHYPSVPNLGDMTKHESWPLDVGSIDLLVGGTPCQSFSVAGLRKGLSDPRGGLMLTYLEIARRLRPRWIVWENVPGVLSSGRGRDFGSFLGALGELGYGWAYRVLDAQWVRTQRHPRAVPQRRRRVFVVGCLGDWTAAAAVLFERESVQRNPSPRGAPRQGVAADAEGCAGTDGRWWDGSDCAATLTKQNANGAQRMPDKDNLGAVLTPWPADVAATLAQSSVGSGSPGFSNQEVFSQGCANIVPIPFRKSKRAQSAEDDETWVDDGVANTLNGFDTGDARTTHAVAFTIDMQACKGNANIGDGSVSPTLCKPSGNDVHAVAFTQNQREEVRELGDCAASLSGQGTHQTNYVAMLNGFDTGDTRTTHAVCFDWQKGNDVGNARPSTMNITEEYSQTLGTTRVLAVGVCVTGDTPTTHAIAHALPDIPKPPEDQVCVECGNDIATAEMWHCMECLEKERQQHAVAFPINGMCLNKELRDKQMTGIGEDVDAMYTVRADGTQHAVAFHPTQDVISAADGSTHCMGTGSGGGCATVAVAQSMTVRRLTPRECERLQAFPDDYTRIPWRKRDAADCPDGPRYKALGNSMAVNCMEWIGERIAAWEAR